jgi:2-haloacid dehalogenase
MGRYEDFWQVTQDGLVFACRSLGLAPSEEQIDHLMQAYLTLDTFPEIAAALEALSTVPSAILSNGSPKMLADVVRNAGLEGRFQHIISVNEVRIYKPSPVVYELAETHLGIRRDDIGFVSSNCWDVAGAKAFGFEVYWLNRQNAPLEVLGFQPDRVIQSAMELATVVA